MLKFHSLSWCVWAACGITGSSQPKYSTKQNISSHLFFFVIVVIIIIQRSDKVFCCFGKMFHVRLFIFPDTCFFLWCCWWHCDIRLRWHTSLTGWLWDYRRWLGRCTRLRWSWLSINWCGAVRLWRWRNRSWRCFKVVGCLICQWWFLCYSLWCF